MFYNSSNPDSYCVLMLLSNLLASIKPAVSSAMKPMIAVKMHTAAKTRHMYTTRSDISALALTKDLLQTRGVTGIYQGLGATLLR